MNTLFKTLLVALMLTLASASAGTAKEAEFYLVGGTSSHGDYDGTRMGFGFGTQKTTDSHIYYGANTNMYMDSADSTSDSASSYSGSINLKLGMEYNRIAVYGLVTIMATMSENYDAYGFGGGAGIEWQAFDHFAIAAEYKAVSMTQLDLDEDYTDSDMLVYLKYLY